MFFWNNMTNLQTQTSTTMLNIQQEGRNPKKKKQIDKIIIKEHLYHSITVFEITCINWIEEADAVVLENQT